jgi:hypothetical protein
VLRPVASLAAVGIIGVFLGRFLLALLLPLFGAAVGFFLFILKVLVIASVIGLGWWCFSKLTDKPSEA